MNYSYLIPRFTFSIFIFINLSLFPLIGQSGPHYLVCGPDEDGCTKDIYSYCLCIPYDDLNANMPYCLDAEQLTCTPLAQKKACNSEYIYPNQGACLAIIFHSVSTPPCFLKTHAFCLKHRMMICAPDGQPQTCH